MNIATHAINSDTFIKGVIELATAYVSRNNVDSAQLPRLIRMISRELAETAAITAVATPEKPIADRFAHLPRNPAVSVAESVTDDAVICLFDGKPMTMLKRYIRAKYGMEEADYRAFWNLPPEHPLVAPSYSRRKSLIAIDQGLGSTVDKTPREKRITVAA